MKKPKQKYAGKMSNVKLKLLKQLEDEFPRTFGRATQRLGLNVKQLKQVYEELSRAAKNGVSYEDNPHEFKIRFNQIKTSPEYLSKKAAKKFIADHNRVYKNHGKILRGHSDDVKLEFIRLYKDTAGFYTSNEYITSDDWQEIRHGNTDVRDKVEAKIADRIMSQLIGEQTLHGDTKAGQRFEELRMMIKSLRK